MDTLPLELKVGILQSVDDLTSLYAIIRTCRTVYAAFKEARSTILPSALDFALPLEIRHEALAVLDSSNLPAPSIEEALEYVNCRLFGEIPREITPGNLNELSRQHILVEWFTNDLCTSVRSLRLRDTHVDIYPFVLCLDERIRIQRAFYRFQLYCNLVPKNNLEGGLGPEEARYEFFDCFPSWENEEIACVHDYLYDKMSIFEEIVKHDIDAARKWRQWDYWHDFYWSAKEIYITAGLSFLYLVFTAKDHEQQKALFDSQPEVPDCDDSSADHKRIGSVLVSCRTDEDYYDESELTMNRIGRLHLDNVHGPNCGWLWAHEHVSKSSLNSNIYTVEGYTPTYLTRKKEDLREWCYAFWSLSKLNAWHVMDKEWTEENNTLRRETREAEEAQKAKDYERRVALRKMGVTGYWTPDESQIVWKDGTIGPEEPQKPTTCDPRWASVLNPEVSRILRLPHPSKRNN